MKRLAGIVVVSAIAGAANADLILSTSGQTLSQDFNTLASSGTANSWVNDSTLSGWYAQRQPDPGVDLATYDAGTGSGTTGILMSYGSASDSDRALGALGSGGTYWGSPSTGAIAGYWGVRIQNNTGLTLTQFTVTYDVEQWRNSAAAAQPLVVEWAIDPANWFDTFNAGATTDSPVSGGTAGALVGNDSANRIADVSFNPTVTWNSGTTVWIRFRELNDSGTDHGLAIDNFEFTAIVPEPATVGLLAGPGLGILVACMRRRRMDAAGD
jgi:hypothetical protein